MFCPHCGKPVPDEGARFCSFCGGSLEGYTCSVPATSADDSTATTFAPKEPTNPFAYVMDEHDLPEEPITTSGSRGPRGHPFRKLAAVAVALLFLTSAAAVIVLAVNNNSDSPEYTVISNNSTDTVLLLNDDEQMAVYLGNGFYSEDGTAYLTATFDSNNNLVITLSSAVTAVSSSYVWTLSEESGSITFTSVTKTAGLLTWYLPQYGNYTVTVDCTDSDGNVTEYIGTLDIEAYYSWTYDGSTYEMTVDVDYADYYDSHATTYSEMQARAVTVWSTVTDFVVVDEEVQSIADQLAELYAQAYGSTALDQSFANFTLAFVQICYTYYYDISLYGQEEYYAYPIETIFNGGGDCEDTSILCAAIFTAEGYQAAVGILPGHAIAGVALDSYTAPAYSQLNYEVLSQKVYGVTYYACETTYDTYKAVGLEPISNGEVYSSYLGQYVSGYGTYGFYPINAD